MLLPMLVLGAAAIISGYLANPQWEEEIGIPRHWISEFLLTGLEHTVPVLVGNIEIHGFSRWLATVSTIGAVSGIALAASLYMGRREAGARDPLETAGKVHTVLANKYYVDALYENVLVRSAFYRLLAGTVDWLDRNIVDGLVDTLGWIFRNLGSAIGRLQTGQVQSYGGVIVFGSLLIILGFLLS